MGEQNHRIYYFEIVGTVIAQLQESEDRIQFLRELIQEGYKQRKEFKFLSNEN